jgi:hypothetical protein
MKRIKPIVWICIAIVLVQLACNAPVPIPLTGAGGSTTMTITPVQIGTPGTPASGACTNKISFVSDVTIPDNSQVPAGKSFTKTWRVRNDGTCTWGPGSYPISGVIYTGGNQMGGPKEASLPGVVQPGQTTDISVQLTAPNTPGNYVGQWMFKVNNGTGGTQRMGVGDNGQGPLYVQIVVK